MIEGLVDRAWSCFQRLSGGDEAKKPDVYSNHQSEGTGWPPSHFYKGFDKNQIISSKSSFDGRTAFSLKEDIHQSEMGTFCSRNSFPLMDNHFLDQAFQHLLDELDLPPEKQRKLLEQPDEKKWLMIAEQNRTQVISGQCIEHSESAIQQLDSLIRNYPDRYSLPIAIQNLGALNVTLRTESYSYVQCFVNLNGVERLVELLNASHRYGPGAEYLAVPILSCLRALMNSSIGRVFVSQSEEALLSISWALDFRNPRCKVLSLEILSGLCLASDEGQFAVLKALTDVTSLLGERTRFQKLIDDLHREYGAPKDTDRVRISIMSLLNTLMKTGASEHSLEFRLHLRYELLMLGIQEIIEQLRNGTSKCSANLEDHLDLFMMMRQEDEQELASLSDSGNSSPIDFESPIEIVETIWSRLENTLAQPHFISVLHHLLHLPTDERHLHLWRLFDLILQQISLHTVLGNFASSDPQFLQPLHLDMDDLLSRLHTQNEYEKLENRLNEITVELDQERRRVIELENRLSDLDGLSLVSSFSRVSELSSSPSDPCHSPTFGMSSSSISSANGTLPPIKPPTGQPPPPPPPSLAQLRSGEIPSTVQVPRKRVPKPSCPLKSMNWTVIPYGKIPGTIWENIDDERMYKYINTDQLCQEFSAGKGSGMDENGTLNRGTIPRKAFRLDNLVSVIDSRRAQNCTIMLSRLKLSHREIRNALLSMDERGKVPKDMIEQMLKFVPTKEEISLLRDTVAKHKSPTILALADRFLFEVAQIPRYERRLMCLFTLRTFKDRIEDMKPNLNAIIRASTIVTSSKKLKQFLALILAIGNFLNYNKRNGNAYGFTVHSLECIQNIRSSAKTDRNLMHFIVELVEKKFPELLRLKRDLASAYEAARINGIELEAELKSIESAIKEVATELRIQKEAASRCLDPNNNSLEPTAANVNNSPKAKKNSGSSTAHLTDTFVPIISNFLEVARKDLDEVQNLHKEMNQTFFSCTKLFAGDKLTRKCSPDEFFGAFSKCLNVFTDCYKAMWEEREEVERNKRQTLVRSLFTGRRRNAKNTIQAEIKASADKNFDLIVNALQTGELFSEELSRLRTSVRVLQSEQAAPVDNSNNKRKRISKGKSRKCELATAKTIIESF